MHPNFNLISEVYSISAYRCSRTMIECFSLSETQSRFIYSPISSCESSLVLASSRCEDNLKHLDSCGSEAGAPAIYHSTHYFYI